MVIAPAALLVVLVSVAWSLSPSQEDFDWFLRLRRPAWLTFEAAIPVIWIAIYACFYASALLVWNATASWLLLMSQLCPHARL